MSENKTTAKRELIKKHLEGWHGLERASIENYLESGRISGSILKAIEKMMDEYLESLQEPKGETAEINRNHYDHKNRMEILANKLGSAYYKTGVLHSSISDAMEEYARQFSTPKEGLTAEQIKELIEDISQWAQLFQGVLPDAKAEGWWSEWDQKQIENMAKWSRILYPLTDLPQLPQGKGGIKATVYNVIKEAEKKVVMREIIKQSLLHQGEHPQECDFCKEHAWLKDPKMNGKYQGEGEREQKESGECQHENYSAGHSPFVACVCNDCGQEI